MQNLIDIKSHAVDVTMNILLKDRTSNDNIILATDDYKGYNFYTQITKKLLLDGKLDIRPRVSKSIEAQNKRTKKKAEVFTPCFICNKMNNFIDEEWLDKYSAFNNENEINWTTLDDKIEFSEGKTWKDYVLSRRLEITCGEAPYLVSRYDAATGELIPVKDRIGILDRKLRVIGENVKSKKEWLTWVYRAYESTYGYEFQGDNLLIARINLLETFVEHMEERWGETPSDSSLKRIARIITYNIWQMDGIRDVLPYSGANEFLDLDVDPNQTDLFGLMDNNVKGKNKEEVKLTHALIYDWKKEKPFLFIKIKECEEMKFDYVIGNPPYQEEAKGTSTSDDPIYHYFVDESYKISKKVILVTPARFLFNAGKTPKAWNNKMLEDKNIAVKYYQLKSNLVFPNTDIKGGVAITYRDEERDFGEIKTFIPYKELENILKKVEKLNEKSLMEIIYNQNKFDLDILYKDYPDYKNIIGSDGKDKRLDKPIFKKLDVFKEAGDLNNDYSILGINDLKREYRFINKRYIEDNGNLIRWKVLVPVSNGSGAIGEVLSTPLIGAPLIGYTRSFIGIGSFDHENHAKALLKYIKSKFARVMLGILKITQDNTAEKWKYVPLQDFTENSDIDWTKDVADIDKQLYKKYNLTEEEIKFIETNVKEME